MTVKVFCIAIYLPNIKYMKGKAMGIDLGFSGIYIYSKIFLFMDGFNRLSSSKPTLKDPLFYISSRLQQRGYKVG